MNRFERWSVWLTAAATTLTGIGLLYTKYFLTSADPWAVINHPLQPAFLKAHIIVSPLFIFALGLVATRHVWNHYRAGLERGRQSGLVMVLAVAPLVLSGYLIQVITHIGWLRAMAVAHIVLGLIFSAGLTWHRLVAKSQSGARHDVPSAATRERRPGAAQHPAVAPGD
jgi:hypothetical protein